MSEKMSDPREVISDFMVEGHLRYEVVGRASDYDRTDAMIRDLAAEGVAIISAAKLATLQREAEVMRLALKYALPIVEKYAHTQGDNAAFHAKITEPLRAALNGSELLRDHLEQSVAKPASDAE